MSAVAEQSVDLYQAELLVTSQSERQRVMAAKVLLEDIIVRVSGETDAGANPVVKRALAKAQDYIYEYGYAETDELTSSLTGQAGTETVAKVILKFSPVLIEALLRDADLPFWPANRPTVLVWVVASEAGGLKVVNTRDVWQTLQINALVRGVPIISPLFDLEDHLALPAESLWNMNERQIQDASSRYKADGIIVLRYSILSNGQWRANWQLLYGNRGRAFDGVSQDVEGLLGQTIDSVAEHFAGLYAISSDDENVNSIVMRFDDVTEFSTYKSIEQYLSKLALVRRVDVKEIGGSRLTLQLYTDGDIARLKHTLALDAFLVPKDSNSVSLPGDRYRAYGTTDSPLLYRWVKR